MAEASDTLAAAESRVAETRAELIRTVGQIGRVLAPKRLARDMWENAKVKGADLAEDAVDAVKARPVATGGAVAALAMFLAREPLMDLAGRLVSKFTDDKKNGAAKAPAPATARADQPAPPRRRAAPKARPAKPKTEETTP